MRVGIIGASGYTGGELLRLLAMHPECEVSCATSRRLNGKSIASVHPNLRGILDMKFVKPDEEKIASKCDFVFTATPHGTSMKVVPGFVESGMKVVDLSGDFRFKDTKIYERYYHVRHEHPEVEAVYGLPELHRQEIKDASLVANPGCYPVSAILGLAPMVKRGAVDVERIVVDSKSGISGAGAIPSDKTHFIANAESVLAYNASSHRHLPEIEEELRRINEKVMVSFVPHLVPLIRGISTTIHCFLEADIESESLQELYSKFYSGEPFIRIMDVGETPRLSAVRASNYIDIGCFEVDKERKRCIVVSALDNLVKGASGNAVQNMNIMMGYDETLGLTQVGVHP
ncbi:MAG: N-acetyl-gamma-glutamyl-phosphate reductase [Candidatus Hydrothermarchaeales archaeon]